MTSGHGFDPDSPYARLELHELFSVAEWQDKISWQPFYPGTEIYRLYGDGRMGPAAALVRFRPGGKVPAHIHTGYEHILVLHGRQRDQNGTSGPGTLMINPPGTSHSVWSDDGCIVLAIYEQSGRFDSFPRPSDPPALP